MSAEGIWRKCGQAVRYARQNGWGVLARLLHWRPVKGDKLPGKVSVTRPYEALLGAEFGPEIAAQQLSPKTINWFIPPVGKGSGGHLNIFRFIRNLEDLGYRNNIVIVGEPEPKSTEVVRREITEWFFPLRAGVYVGDDDHIPAAWFAMATSWPTAYYVRRFRGSLQKCYFVQDYEPWFYPAGSDALLAEASYRFGFVAFTAGGWLAQKLHDEHGMQTYAVGFSYDRDLYHLPLAARVDDGLRRIMFYARPPTARRAFELGVLVLREAAKRVPSMRVVLAGWDVRGYEIPFPCEHAGLMPLDQLSALYQGCDAALVLSCSNLSLLPLELMASGVPVISNRAPYTQWLLNDENAKLADPDIQSLVEAVVDVLETPAVAQRLRRAGAAFAEATSWEREAARMAEGLAALAGDQA